MNKIVSGIIKCAIVATVGLIPICPRFLDTYSFSVGIELTEERIAVYTKAGDIIFLPKGSTPVDFAYSIHTEIGNHMVGAIVNGEAVLFNYKLKPGDRVEIITNELSSVIPDIRFAKTAHARRRIREYLK